MVNNIKCKMQSKQTRIMATEERLLIQIYRLIELALGNFRK